MTSPVGPTTCTRCGIIRTTEPDYTAELERTGVIGWMTNHGSQFCPDCVRKLLRSLPPIGPRGPRPKGQRR